MQALDNLRVLDLSRSYPAAIAAMYLADFGAEVIKVESPVPRGDQSERYLAFSSRERNKKSIVLDLKRDDHRGVLNRLVKTADVLIENNRPGVMKRLRCDYETLKSINPRLIYCACSGFGQDGPYAQLPGHDMNYIAVNGALSLVGPRGGPPCFPSNMVGDMAGCVLHAAIGILIAVAYRERSGRGQFVDISYMDGAMATMVSEMVRYFYTGVIPKRGETRLTGGALWAQVFLCKDGEYLAIGCAEQELWDNFCGAIGREDLKNKKEATGSEKERLVAELGELFITKSRDEWFEFFKDKNTCASPVNNMDEAVRDPHVLHRGMIVEFDHPILGKIPQLGIPIKLSETPGSIRSLGVPPGTDTREILQGLGYSAEEIAGICGRQAR